MRSFSALIAAFTVASVAVAKDVVVTVGGNTTTNATMVFQPAEIFAANGDVIIFNFTMGNHSVTESLFASPCVPAHDANVTINGFDSGLRNTVNGTAITQLRVLVTAAMVNTTTWFYDFNTCAEGGVGGINIDDNSTATLDGFVRNAIRLNGTGSLTSSIPSPTGTVNSPRPSSTSPSGGSSSGAVQHSTIAISAFSVIPFVAAALALL
ncbi:hypothetical protein C8Q75DRAFT_889231 [Abortiporus biennis]|nr:hypothetical protein C8Q75DRAFT_889231 [Abortiporus biennis]